MLLRNCFIRSWGAFKDICKPSVAHTQHNLFRFYVNDVPNDSPKVCVVGSGPSGFSITQTLLKNHPSLLVDMYEKLPVPFGLIRYGVAPDHQDVKNCINGYNKTAESHRFSFYGNIEVGKDVSLDMLWSQYHAVILCTGAQKERNLNIPGQKSKNIFTSKQFVGWYNGLPEYQKLDIDLSGGNAVIVGVGNVALDVARMLLKPQGLLKETDIATEAHEKLLQSNIKNVFLIGRRGPLQMACTRKELSEITDLPHISTSIEEEHFGKAVQDALKKKDLKRRKQQRLVSYLLKMAKMSKSNVSADSNLSVLFLRAPLEIITNNKLVKSIKFLKYRMKDDNPYEAKPVSTEEVEEIPCDLLVSCIGYDNEPIDSAKIPFENGKIVQVNGRILDDEGLYACGWCNHGAKGVLADSSNDSMLTGSTVLSDLHFLFAKKGNLSGSRQIITHFKNSGKTIVKWNDWKKIDHFEVTSGKKMNKIREKVLSYDEMISFVRS
ncbi:NADPH:adrenodoxin oxidoreductase, mitochondrial-like isoform X1 [Clavelina lepadiformis]|uniref:NADPH:adrenodoxin oxidoreductase, mitochondrial-like isoform X1 n=1 Tax=Clavelina lepadiformis TaxID=159417 RepID=UPI004042167E